VYLRHGVWHVVGGNRVVSAPLTALYQMNCAVYCLSSKGYLRTSRIVRVFVNDVCVALCASNKVSFLRAAKASDFIIVRSEKDNRHL
jgi:hypothetical protein